MSAAVAGTTFCPTPSYTTLRDVTVAAPIPAPAIDMSACRTLLRGVMSRSVV